MKKARPLIIVVMTLAIVTCLCAGTLAIYTTKIDDAAEVAVAAKPFVLTTNTVQNQSLDIKLAPGDVRGNGRGEEILFTVRNYDDNTVAEVPIKVDFSLISSGEIFKINGLDIKIIDDAHPLADELFQRGRASWLYGYSSAGRSGLKLQYEPENPIILPADVRTERTFRIRYQWINNEGKDKEHTRAANEQLSGSLQLRVVGQQVVEQTSANAATD